MALSATCGPQVLEDLIRILGLRKIVDGNGTLLSVNIVRGRANQADFNCADAEPIGTVFFSSPLYRKNLHYRVVPKPDKAADQIVSMKEYIMEHHPNDTGIIYCYSVKVCSLAYLHSPYNH